MPNPCSRTEYPLCEKCPWFSFTKEEEGNAIVHHCAMATSDPTGYCDQCGEYPCKCDGDWSEHARMTYHNE